MSASPTAGAEAISAGRMGEAPKVTAIITVFKRTTFLRSAIESVLHQDDFGCEIIVMDDSASDEIKDIVLGFADDGITYVPSIPRRGVALAVADGLARARGDYVAILNDDDLWEPNFLAELVPPLDRDPSCVLAFSDHWIMGEDGLLDQEGTDAHSRSEGRLQLPEGELASPAELVVLGKIVPMVMGALFRRSAVDPSCIAAEVGGAYDYWIACVLAASGETLYYKPLRLTRYRVHGQMETLRRDPEKRKDELFVLASLLKNRWFTGIDRPLRARFARVASSASLNKLRFGERQEARRLAGEGLRKSRSLRCVLAYVLTLLPPMVGWKP